MELFFKSDEHKKVYEQYKSRKKYNDILPSLYILSSLGEDMVQRYLDVPENIWTDICGVEDNPFSAGERKLIRLAYNLFTWRTADGDDIRDYAPASIFSGLDAASRSICYAAIELFATL